MRILVTGGHGFIWRHVVRRLCLEGHDVLALDLQLPPAELEGLHYRFLNADVFNFELLRTVTRTDFDTVVHLVGLADARAAQEDPAFSFRLNLEALKNVLEVCRINEIGWVILPSTAAVYGLTRQVPIPEEAPPQPTSLYAYHKLMAEFLVQAYQRNFGIDYTILRLFNVFGRGNKGIIDLCVRKARRGESLVLFGADQLRDFVYTGDVAEAFAAAVRSEAVRNQVLNIGSGQGYTIRQIVELAREVLPGLEAEFAERPDYQPYDSVADNRRARDLLGFRPGASPEFIKKIIREEMLDGSG